MLTECLLLRVATCLPRHMCNASIIEIPLLLVRQSVCLATSISRAKLASSIYQTAQYAISHTLYSCDKSTEDPRHTVGSLGKCLQTIPTLSSQLPRSWQTLTFPSATAKISLALHSYATSPWSAGLSTFVLRSQQTTTILTFLSRAADQIAVSVLLTTILHSPPTTSTRAPTPDFPTHTTTAQHPIRDEQVQSTTAAPDFHLTRPRGGSTALSTARSAAPSG